MINARVDFFRKNIPYWSFLSLLFLLFEYLIGYFNTTAELTYFYIIQLFAFLVASYLFIIKNSGYLHLFSLFYVATFVFTFGGILVTAIAPKLYDFKSFQSLVYVDYTEDLLQKALLLNTIFLNACFLFFYLLLNKKRRSTKIESEFKESPQLYKIGKYTMIVMFPLAIVYSYLIYKAGAEDRGVLYMLGSNEALGIPLYVRLTNLIFQVGYYLIIASKPTRKQFLISTAVYLFTTIPLIIMGERGDVVVVVLFLLWYETKVYGKGINIVKLLIIALIIAVASQIIAYTRDGSDIASSNIWILFLLFLSYQSISFNILPLYIMTKPQMPSHTYPYFLDSFISGFMPVGQNLEVIKTRSSLSHHLMYTLNPDYYFSGYSTSSTFLAESFEFGVVGVICGGGLVAIMIYLLEEKIFTKNKFVFFAYYVFYCLILSPRGSLFPSLYTMIKYSIVAAALYFLFRSHKKQRI